MEADVWALGCMLYTMLVGRPPFDTDGVRSTLTKVVMSDIKVSSRITLTKVVMSDIKVSSQYLHQGGHVRH